MIINPYVFAAAPSSGYYAAMTALAPIAYWRLGESSGTTADDDAASFNGTYVGSPTLGVSGAIAGNTAVDFDGTDDRVDLPALGISGNAARSVVMFLKSDSTGSLQAAFYSGDHVEDGTTNKKLFVIYSSVIDTGDIYLQTNGRDYHTAGAVAPANSWTHVVVTYDGGSLSTSTIKIYINGVSQSLTELGPATGTLSTTDDTCFIGYNIATTSRYFNGAIDEVAVLDFALNSTQVSDLYAAI